MKKDEVPQDKKIIHGEDNSLVKLHIEKVYKAQIVSKTKWNEMLAFLDAAYGSTFKYILITPTK